VIARFNTIRNSILALVILTFFEIYAHKRYRNPNVK
jgi:hypothetical protein